MCCTRLAEIQDAPSHNFVGLYLRNEGIYRQSKKNLSSNISSTRLHNMAKFGLLTAEIGSVVWGTPTNSNRFRVLASLLQGRRSVEANQTQHDVWPSLSLADTLHIHFWGLLSRNGILPGAKIHFVSKSCALLYFQRYCMALEQCASAKLCGVEQREPPIFDRAAITLGIDPHFQFMYSFKANRMRKSFKTLETLRM